MSETAETQVETPATEEAEETTAETTATEQEISGEPATTLTQADVDRIVKERLARQQTKHEEQIAALKATPAAEEKPEEKSPVKPPPPPEGADEMESARHYIRHFGLEAVEEALGMPVAQVKALLGATKTVSEAHATQVWEDGCKEHGMDSTSEDHRRIVAGLIQSQSMSVGKAFALAGKYLGKKSNGAEQPAETVDETASVETGGVVPTMLKEGGIPKDKHEAHAMAAKGIRAKQLSSGEIIARAIERERGK